MGRVFHIWSDLEDVENVYVWRREIFTRAQEKIIFSDFIGCGRVYMHVAVTDQGDANIEGVANLNNGSIHINRIKVVGFNAR